MAIGFELRVCRLIDIGPQTHQLVEFVPLWRTGWTHFDFHPLRVRGCVCHQTARPCLKFRAIQPWNIDIPCQRSRIPQGRHQRTLFATDYVRVATISLVKLETSPSYRFLRSKPNYYLLSVTFSFSQFLHRRSICH